MREALLRLVDDRRSTVTVDAHGVAIAWRGRHLPAAHAGLRRRVRAPAVQATLTELHQLTDSAASALRAHRPQPVSAQADDDIEPHAPDELAPLAEALARHPRGQLLLVGPMLLFVGPAFLFWGIDYPPLTWHAYLLGLAGGAIVLAAYGGLAYRIMRGRTRSLRDRDAP